MKFFNVTGLHQTGICSHNPNTKYLGLTNFTFRHMNFLASILTGYPILHCGNERKILNRTIHSMRNEIILATR
jgi:hypothetical protein